MSPVIVASNKLVAISDNTFLTKGYKKVPLVGGCIGGLLWVGEEWWRYAR